MNTLLRWRSCIRSTCCLRVALGAALAHGLLACGNAYGQTNESPIHYVWASGGNASSYTNWETAATTIQAAVNAAHLNDTVLIRAGTYRGSGNRMIMLNGKDLVLRAETDESPVIDCESSADGIRLYFHETTNTVIDGLTFTATSGGAINLSRSGATIRHCLITSNRFDTGINASDASEVVIEDCVITNQTIFSGISIGPYCTGTVRRCLVVGNGTGISSSTDSKTTIADCLVSNNGIGIDLYSGKDVVVTNCVISQNRKRGVHIYGARSPLIIDSTVIGNLDDYNGGAGIGGGTAVVQGCLIANNFSRGGGGGGLLLSGATSMVIRCVVSNNIAMGNGGGAYLGGSFVISNSVFCDNVSSNSSFQNGGGGIQYGLTGMMVIEDTIVERNRTTGYGGGILSMNRYPATLRRVTLRDNTAEGSGGGIYTYDQNLVITNCAIYGNQALHGGGIYMTDMTAPRIVRCLIYSNTVSGNGGGIYAGSTSVKPWLENCLIHHNTAADGGGIVAWSAKMTLMNCTVTANTAVGRAIGDASRPGAGGMSAPFGTITNINSIYYGDTLPEIETNSYTVIVMAHSTVQGGWPGDHNLNADPLFRNATAGDYHLAASSPCIDAGTALGAPSIDLDGTPRPLKGGTGSTPGVDIGAYEFVNEAADTDGDGLPDGWEVANHLDPSVTTGSDGTTGDPDGDGMPNAHEYAAVTDPNNALSVLRLTNVDVRSNMVSVSWSGGQQAWQCLERAETLSNTGMTWSVLSSNPPPNAVTTTFTDVSATTNKAYFYRIRSGRQ